MDKPRLFDVVKLTSPVTTEGWEDDDSDIDLGVGEAGTIVEVFDTPDEAYMVEFINHYGEAIAMPTLTADQFEVVWRAPIRERVAP